MRLNRTLLHLTVLGLGTSLVQTVHADNLYLFLGDKVSDPQRPGNIHRYELDAKNPTSLKPAPSAGLSGDFWDKSASQPFNGTRFSDMVVGPDGNLYAVSLDTKSVLRFDGKTGEPKGTVIGNLDAPEGLTIGPDGNLYITSNDVVIRTDLTGKPLPGAEQTGRNFTSGAPLINASGIAFGPDGNLYVASQSSRQIVRFDGRSGKAIDVFHSGGVTSPSEIAWGPDGNLYVASTGGEAFNANNGYVAKIDGITGKRIDGFATDAKGALGLAFGPDGNLLVTDYFTAQLKRYDAKTGKLLNTLAGSPERSNFFYMALAKQAETPGAPLQPWTSPIPKRSAASLALPATAKGADTVKGWKDALTPKGTVGPLLNLAAAQKTAYTIALPANPGTQDEKAAVVLAWWLKEITGAEFPIVREGGATALPAKVISVGKTAFWKAANLTSANADLKDEGYAIAAKGDDLFLWGGKTRGAIYAVNALLEEDLGVRWYTSEPNGFRVPRKATLAFQPKIRQFVPPLFIRDPYYGEAFNADWSLKNRTNAYRATIPNEYGGYAKHSMFGHSFAELVPSDKYFATHPEYFAEIAGKRVNSQLELTNPDVLRISIEKVKQSLRENPGSKMVSISPNDGRGYSESKESRAIDEAEATFPGSKTGTLLKFVNAVAEGIEDEYPDVQVSFLAYLDTFTPPKTIRPHKNVVVQLCTDSHAWKYQFCFTPESETFQSALKAWHNIGATVHIWDYTTSYVHFMVPMPNLPVVTDNMKFYMANGAKGIMLQGNYVGVGGENSNMRSWVWAKQLFDPSLDTKALMRDFIFGYYGDAAQPIWDYNMMLWELWEENHKQPHVCGKTPIGVNKLIIDSPCSANPDWELFDKTFMDKTRAYFKSAEALAKDPVTKYRVESAKLPLLYLELGQGLGWITEFRDYKAGSYVKARNGVGKAHYQKLFDEYMRITQAVGVSHISEASGIGALTSKWELLLKQDAASTPVAKLNPKWAFKTDPADNGLAQGLQLPATSTQGWSEVYNDKANGWESQGFKDYKGYAWYRQNYQLPADFKINKNLYLYFGAVDSESEVYVNGEKVFDHTMATTGITLDQIWNAPFAIDVTKLWKVGQANTVAVRVTSHGGVRGVWKPTFMVSSDDELKAVDVQNIVIPFQ